MEDMVNEFGDEIDGDQVEDFIERINGLSDNKIDELWSQCEFVFSGH